MAKDPDSRGEKNKANKPAFGRKPEALSSKSETKEVEKTKPICEKSDGCSLNIVWIHASLHSSRTVANGP